ncbi:MAG: hypothetical protein AB1491_02580 [Thermodesulfobacteriota bacterium]
MAVQVQAFQLFYKYPQLNLTAAEDAGLTITGMMLTYFRISRKSPPICLGKMAG